MVVAFFRRPQLKIDPRYEYERIGPARVRSTIWFHVSNIGKNTARQVRVQVALTPEKGKVQFPEFERLMWQLPDGSKVHETDIPYRDERRINWFSRSVDIRDSETGYEYIIDDVSIAQFPKGSTEAISPVSLLGLSIYGSPGLEKHFLATLFATANPDQMFCVEMMETKFTS